MAMGLAGSETRDWKTRGIQAAYYLGMILALLVLPFLVFIGVDPWGWAVV
ncbi:MAG: hypothetical protein GWN24_07940, partial [Nitrospinaceae bacterium]|nr:hypothetical protein [Nitrospinaceae bacterium]